MLPLSVYATYLAKKTKMNVIQTTNNNYYEGDHNRYYEDRTATTKCSSSVSMSSRNNKRVTKKKMKKKRVVRRVHFSHTVYIKKTISIVDMTEKEISDTWLQEHEEYDIRQECQTLIAQFEQQQKQRQRLNKGTVDMRGLESCTKHGKTWKDINRNERKMLVLEKQYEQQYINEDRRCIDNGDDKEIASVCKRVSTICQLCAQLLAIQDRSDIERYYDRKDDDNKSATTTIRI